MENELAKLRAEARSLLPTLGDTAAAEEFRVQFLGRKGKFSTIMRSLGSVDKELRPRLGQLANTIKTEIEELFAEKLGELRQGGSSEDELPDLSLPGRIPPQGGLHPVTQVMEEICTIFESLGFFVAEGPEVEESHYNFDALNIPPHHPARDMHDTFYFSDSLLLRTHTSPMQARVMEQQQPPLRMIAPGKVFRSDSDMTHTPMFHQVEGLMVDKDISFADLKGILTIFTRRMFA
ncbi:MAG: phenylalanine--tRNA ligase subunit alpha, partial [Desulfobacterales bacterium]